MTHCGISELIPRKAEAPTANGLPVIQQGRRDRGVRRAKER